MNAEIKAKLDELDRKINELGEKTKDDLDTAKIKATYAKDEAKEKIEEKKKEYRGSIEALKENLRMSAEKVEGRASAELLKAQMNIDVAKERVAAKKEAYDKAKMEEYIDEVIMYAESCVELSILAAKEAKLAVLEAVAAQTEYEERYGVEQ